VKLTNFFQLVEKFRLCSPAHRYPDTDPDTNPIRSRPPPTPNLEANQISHKILQDTQIPRSCGPPPRLDQRWSWLQFRTELILQLTVHRHYLDRGHTLLWRERVRLVVRRTEKGAETATVGGRGLSASTIWSSTAIPGACCAVEGFAWSNLMQEKFGPLRLKN
jgi:hypothetical protein